MKEMPMKKKRSGFRFTFILLLLVCCQALKAQQGNTIVVGKVSDTSGEALIGVSVSLKNTTKATVTDLDGNYSISVSGNANSAVLVFSYLGFDSQEKTIGNQKQINVTLKESGSTNLDEVVVIGYGTVARRDLTGAVDKVNIGEMQKASVIGFDQSLAGRIAGVNVISPEGTPGADAEIVIRGTNSITQDNAPLYVVDGFPLESSLSSVIDPKDIASIEVLKDASATAIYGARGANGVIMITTKTGTAQKATLTYDGYYGVQKVIKTMDLLDGYEFVRLQGEVLSADLMADRYFYDGRTLDNYRGTGVDFQDYMFDQASMQKHGISLMGGDQSTKYSLSLSYTGQDGILINTGFDRIQGRMSLDHEVRKGFKMGARVSYSHTKHKGGFISQSEGTNNFLQNTWAYRPVTGSSEFDLENDLFDPIINTNDNYRVNPIVGIKNEVRNRYYNFFMANGYMEIDILPVLKLRSTLGYTKNYNRNDSFDNSNTRSGNPFTGSRGVNGDVTYEEKDNWVTENTLSFKKKKGKNSYDALIGLSMQEERRVFNYVSMQMLPNEVLGMSGLDEGDFYRMQASRASWSLFSYYARFNYNYNWKYYVTATVRADGSSKFSKDNRWGYFPSGSLMWRFNKEDFMKNLRFVSDAKLRASWGITGNNRVSDFAYLAQITTKAEDKYYWGNTPLNSSAKTVLGNPDLKWESTMQTNIGMDLSFFDGRLTLTTDLYKKNTKDLLLNAELPGSTGYRNSFKNIGEIQNKGVEFTLNTVNIATKDFTWETNFNIAFNKNKVCELAENQEVLSTSLYWDTRWNNLPAYVARIGEPLGQMFGYVYEGTYKYDDFIYTSGDYLLKDNIAYPGTRANVRPGDMKYKDINDDGIIDDNDRTLIGRGTPIHTGGFTNTFKYKDFDLSVFFQWSYGNDILNANKYMFERYYMPHSNMYASYANRWTPDNPNSNIPRVNEGSGSVYSSYVIEDGSYLRLKTITLGYNIPNKFSNKFSLQNVRINVSAQNLFTITDYSGMDPEVSTRSGALNPGFDFSAYPRAKTITIGLNMSLK